MASKALPRVYNIRPITPYFGVECIDCDLSCTNLKDERFVKQLKDDLKEYRAILFRKQDLSGQRQVDISNVLGSIQSTFYKHLKSPHPDIFRVSNNGEEGCTSVGRSGWHLDGTFQMMPFMYQTMYFPSVAMGGDTYFVPLKELYDSFSKEEKEYYEKLWMVTGRREAPVHPLVYKHPFRANDETTMLFHCGKPFVQGWYQDQGDDTADTRHTLNGVDTSKLIPAGSIQNKLTKAIESNLEEIGLKMKWEQGDFMISDNLGLAHYASEGTQESSQIVGLRILHRTTIVGGSATIPRKADGRQSFASDASNRSMGYL